LWRFRTGPRVLRELGCYILYDVYATTKTHSPAIDAQLREDYWRIATEIQNWELLQALPSSNGTDTYASNVVRAIRTLQIGKVGDLDRSKVEPTHWDSVRLWLPSSIPIVLIVIIGSLSLAARLLPNSAQQALMQNFGQDSVIQTVITAMGPLISVAVALSSRNK
jgi:hypothetical protein